ncbi:MAG: hypothetical protein LC737_11185, partial [Chloroflexi bacterium]|nr:hypothetical protein [Chloroflexota bacterium]
MRRRRTADGGRRTNDERRTHSSVFHLPSFVAFWLLLSACTAFASPLTPLPTQPPTRTPTPTLTPTATP